MTTNRTIELLGAAVGEGAPDSRCRAAPAVLRRWGLARRLGLRGRRARWGPSVRSDLALLDLGPLAVVSEFSPRLAAAVAASMGHGRLPIVIGGDHSCAVGTWSGAAHALRERGPLGLIWIDAHLDSHTPETSETQMPHGMPLAALLGHGPPQLTQVADDQPKLRPEHLVLIGPRSWEAGEAALLSRLGVRVITSTEVGERGFRDCIDEALARVRDATAGWGLSFDLDALDPADAPGTGTPVELGIRLDEVAAALHGLAGDERFVAGELVEYNPALDPQRVTAAAVETLLSAMLADRPPARPDRERPALQPGGGAA
ncbi:MAG TPA: arginase [Burkholderiaceae bacterium]|jgi:arginase|nr:arginase [Burkholderiaceae bacterium]